MEQPDTIIHIEWDGPHRLDSVGTLKGPTDYGVYQIYGGHPVYGSSALLYIGRASNQYFASRLAQEGWWLDNRDAGRVEVYVGRLAGGVTPENPVWETH